MASDGWEAVLDGDALPANRLTRVEVGGQPALARMAHALGWRSMVVDDGGSENEHDAPSVVTSLDLEAAGCLERFSADPAAFLPVATEA